MSGAGAPAQARAKTARGRAGAEERVRRIPLRASVTGVGGTFELTRMLHSALAARRRRVFATAGVTGQDAPAASGLRRRLREDRLLAQVRRAGPLDALVLESREPGASGLAFNARVCQAQAVLLTQVARDPRDGSLRPDARRAADFARAAPPCATLVSGERDPALRDALRDGAREAGAFFVDAAPRGPEAATPGVEAVAVLDRFLRIRLGAGLTSAERVQHLSRLQRRLQWSPSALPDVRWHDGTGLEAADLRPVVDHLSRRWPARVHVVACFEGDGSDALRLVPVLQRAFEDGAVAHAYVAGAGSRPLMRALGSRMPVTLSGRSPATVPGLLRILRRECHGGALVAVGHSGAPWMRALLDRVRLPGLPRGAWAPYGAQASALPAPVGPPAAAPGFGRRSRANILGDPDLPPPPRRPQPIAPLQPQPKPVLVAAQARQA